MGGNFAIRSRQAVNLWNAIYCIKFIFIVFLFRKPGSMWRNMDEVVRQMNELF